MDDLSVDDEVVAIATMQNDPVAAQVSELFSMGKMLTATEIRAGKVSYSVHTMSLVCDPPC